MNPLVSGAWAFDAASETDSAAPRSRNVDEPGGTADAEQKKRIARAAGYVVLGILSLGLALIALVILWGRRMRRIARKPLRRQLTLDELWYLRPKKAPPVPDTKPQNDDQP